MLYNYKTNSKNINKSINILMLSKKYKIIARIKSQSDKKKNNIFIFHFL